MPLFARRLIQNRLNGIAHLLTWSNADHIVKRLNRPDISAVSAQWEVIVTSILDEICDVKFEPVLEGRRFADLLLGCGDNHVLADIAAISNAGLRGLNPYDEFIQELIRRVTKRKLSTSGFHVEIESTLTAKGPKKRVSTYAIPPISMFHEAFSLAFDCFLDEIRAAPDREHTFTFADPYKVTITRTLQGRYMTGNIPGYDAFDANDSPIFSVVGRKRRQIRAASKKYPIGVFLCDAGAEAFHQPFGSSQFSLENIARRVFNKYRDVGFLVFLLADPAKNRSRWIRNRPRCIPVFNDQVAIPDAIKQVLNEIEKRVPRAETRTNDSNLWQRLKYLEGKEGARFFGSSAGVRFTDREHMYIKISARSLLDLLTQKLSIEDFMRETGFDPRAEDHGAAGYPFHDLERMTLKAVKLEKCPDDDDDWLVFELDGNDPALNPILNPVIKD